MDDRFSQIETMWSMVRRAHDDGLTVAGQAQQDLLERYGGAVRRYALAALRSDDAADDVFQEFALKFVRGDFASADPERGRFRSFVKTIVYRLIVDYQRRQKKRAREVHLPTATPEIAQDEQNLQDDEQFRKSWRDELLARCWSLLATEQADTGKPYHTALKLRVDNPELRSPDLAKRLSTELGKPMSAGNTRVLLHRARDRFADLLLQAVFDTLATPSLEDAEQELIELDLFEYCRPALERHRES